jgi:hypothetical protein
MDLESKYCYFYHSWDFVPYKVFCIFNYFWGCGFLVFYCLVIYCPVFYYLVLYCLATFDLYCDWSKQSHEYALPIRNPV